MENKLIIEVQVNVKNMTNEINREEHYSDVIGSREAAEVLGIHPMTLVNWRKKGKVKYRMVGRTCLYSRKDILSLSNQIEIPFFNKKGGNDE